MLRTLIPHHLLIASGGFGARLSAQAVAGAIARGVLDAGRPQPDLCPLEPAPAGSAGRQGDATGIAEQLDVLDFDARMRASRAVVVAWKRLEEGTLAGSVPFEIATRARQGGVPAYAITAHDRLDEFDARIFDLQVVIEARSAQQLAAAGRRLAELA